MSSAQAVGSSARGAGGAFAAQAGNPASGSLSGKAHRGWWSISLPDRKEDRSPPDPAGCWSHVTRVTSFPGSARAPIPPGPRGQRVPRDRMGQAVPSGRQVSRPTPPADPSSDGAQLQWGPASMRAGAAGDAARVIPDARPRIDHPELTTRNGLPGMDYPEWTTRDRPECQSQQPHVLTEPRSRLWLLARTDRSVRAQIEHWPSPKCLGRHKLPNRRL